MSSSVYETGLAVTAYDGATAVFRKIGSHWDSVKQKLKMSDTDMAWVKQLEKRILIAGSVFAIAGGMFISTVGSMTRSRIAIEELTGDIRTLGATDSEIQKIETATANLSARLGLSQSTLLTGVYDIKSAVSTLDMSTLPEFTEAIGKTAIATKGSFEELSKTFGMVYNQFAHRYKHLSDVEFAKNLANNVTWMANKFRADGETINQAFTTLGSSAAVAGITLEEQSAVIGRLLNTMVPSTAGNSFRVFIDKLDTGLAKIGISKIDPVTKKMKSIPDILDEISKKYPDMGKSAKILNEAFSEEGLKMIKELTPHTAALRDDMAEIASASMGKNWKFLDEASAKKLETLPANLRRIQEGWTSLWGQISGASSGPLLTATSLLADMLEWFVKIAGEHPRFAKFIGTTALLVTGLTALVAGIVAVRSAMMIWTIMNYYNTLAQSANLTMSSAHAIGLKALGTSFVSATTAAWGFTVALLTNPITWIVLGVVALVAGLGALIYYWDDVSAATTKWFTETKAAFSNFAIPGWVQGLAAWLMPLVTLPLLAIAHWETLKGIAGDLFAGNLEGAVDKIKNLAKRAGFGFIFAFIDGIKAAASDLWSGVGTLFEKLDRYLPHSDAREGPLSRLTASGRSLVTTFATGMIAATPILANTSEDLAKEALRTPTIVSETLSGSGGSGSSPKFAWNGDLHMTLQYPKSNSRSEFRTMIIEILTEIIDKETHGGAA